MKVRCKKEGCNAWQMNDGSGFCFSHNLNYISEKRKTDLRFGKKKPREEIYNDIIENIENLKVEEPVETRKELKSKSIFNSPIEEKFYALLKEFVVIEKFDENCYPQVPLSAFIDFDDIKNDLTPREQDYFFKARVDIARTNKRKNNLVEGVIEIDGRNHIYGKDYDKMKDKILNLAGIIIERFNTDKAKEHIGIMEEAIRKTRRKKREELDKLFNNLSTT